MKDQFVIACIESLESANAILPWARHFAECLNHKGLMVLHVNTDDNGNHVPDWLKSLNVPYVSMHGSWSTAIEGLPTAFNGILAVTAVNPRAPRTSLTNPKTLLRQFKNCKTAYLCINTVRNYSTYKIQQTALTMTHRREGKEKLVWASYLERFLGSSINISHPDYRDGDLRKSWLNNMQFAEKMFRPLGVEYKSTSLLTGHSSISANLDIDTLEQLQPDLLIARTTDTRDRDLVDFFLPLPEYRLLMHSSQTHLLFLNPRDDLYILCD